MIYQPEKCVSFYIGLFHLESDEEENLYWPTSKENKQPTRLCESQEFSVLSGVPYDWLLGPILFKTFI